MQGIYAHIWTSRWPTPETLRVAKAEWTDGLLGCSDERIQIGIERCRKRHPKGPTLTEFIMCCLPSLREFGLPEPNSAYMEACRNAHRPNIAKWSHPAVYWGGQRTGWLDLHCCLEGGAGRFQGVKDRFGTEYKVVCRQVMSGAELHVPRPDGRSLTQHRNGQEVRTIQEKQTAQHWLGQMKQALGG